MSEIFQMYHGGKKWSVLPTDVQASKRGRYEGGVGIYFTNSYTTARKYAKGSRVVHKVDIDGNFKDASSVKIPLEKMVEFLKRVPRLKHRSEIIADVTNYATRVKSTEVSANVLNNLVVNYEAGSGPTGIAITRFFIENGVDASKQNQSGDEFWLVVFNPKILKKVVVTNPNSMSNDDWMLPKL